MNRAMAAFVACASAAFLGGCTYHAYTGPARPRSRIAVVGTMPHTYVERVDGSSVPGWCTEVAVLPGSHSFKVRLAPYLNIFSPGKWATLRANLAAGRRYRVNRNLDEVWVGERWTGKKVSERVGGGEEGSPGTAPGPAEVVSERRASPWRRRERWAGAGGLRRAQSSRAQGSPQQEISAGLGLLLGAGTQLGYWAEAPLRDTSALDHSVVVGVAFGAEATYPRACYRQYQEMPEHGGSQWDMKWFWQAGLSAERPSGGLLAGAGVRFRPTSAASSSLFIDCSLDVVTAGGALLGMTVGWTFGGEAAALAAPSYLAEGASRTELLARKQQEAAEAARELASLLRDPTEEGVPILIHALGDRTRRTRRRAAAALGRLGPAAGDAAPALSRVLNDGDVGVRLSASRALVRIGPAAVPSLRRALQDTDPHVQRRAADVLGRIDPTAELAAATTQREEEPGLPPEAAEAGPEAREPAEAEPKAETVMVARKARKEAPRVRREAETVMVARKARKEAPRVRRKAETVMVARKARKEAPRVRREVNGLIELVKNAREAGRLDDARLWLNGVLSLDPDHEEARRELDEVDALIAERERKRDEYGAREEARRLKSEVDGLMGRVKDAREAGRLDEALLRLCDVLSLVPDHEEAKRQLDEVDALIAGRERKSREDAQKRAAALKRPTEEGVPFLIQALEDEHRKVRRRAAAALARIGPAAGAAAPALAGALKDADPEVRGNAVGALVRIGPAAVPVLVQALGDADTMLRRRAARALGRIGTLVKTGPGPPLANDAVLALTRALEDTDRYVRWSAAVALGKIGPAAREAVPALTRALEDTDRQISRSAAEALEKIQVEE